MSRDMMTPYQRAKLAVLEKNAVNNEEYVNLKKKYYELNVEKMKRDIEIENEKVSLEKNMVQSFSEFTDLLNPKKRRPNNLIDE